MRFVLLSALLLVPAMASADPATCKNVAAVPADATDAQLQLAAKVSLANCQAEQNFNQLKLAPDDASMRALTAAAQPSLDMLDDVIRSGDSTMVPIAQAARADLLASMAVRMRDSIAPVSMDTVGAPLAEHDREHADVEAKIKPWLDQSQTR